MGIGTYSISGHLCLLVVILLMIIGNYSINRH
jgi:hypothetical protein